MLAHICCHLNRLCSQKFELSLNIGSRKGHQKAWFVVLEGTSTIWNIFFLYKSNQIFLGVSRFLSLMSEGGEIFLLQNSPKFRKGLYNLKKNSPKFSSFVIYKASKSCKKTILWRIRFFLATLLGWSPQIIHLEQKYVFFQR